MGFIVEHVLDPTRLVLAETLSGRDIQVAQERTFATDSSRPVLFAWVEGSNLDAFDAAVADDPTVTDVRILSESDRRRLYRFQVTDATPVITYPELTRLGAQQLEARFQDGSWYTRTRFADPEAVDEYGAFLEANDVDYRIIRRYSTEGTRHGIDGLTDIQRETLVLAYRRGYFAVPREVTTEELGEELGVSNQAVSERLRRGYAKLVERGVQV